MPVTVRRATRADADAIAGFAIALVQQHVDYDGMRFSSIGSRSGMAGFYESQMDVANAAVLVVEHDGELVGFAYLQYEPMLYAELATNVAWLHDIYVAPDARGSGAGRELIGAAAVEAKHFGAAKMLLSVAAQNVGAREFFEHEGFKTTMFEMMLPVDKN